MPIDYLSKRKNAEKSAFDMASGRNIGDELTRSKANITSRTGDFLGGLSGTIKGVGGVGATTIADKIGVKNAALNANLAKRKYAGTRSKYEVIFNNAYDLATQYNMDAASATAYARQIAEQSRQQGVAAGEAQKGRDFKLKMDALAGKYADQGVALQDQYAPDSDNTGALLRILLGTGVGLGSSYFLTKNLYGNSGYASAPQYRPDPTYPSYPKQTLGTDIG